MAVEFNILGPLEIRHDGMPLDLGGTRRKALLAALLLRPNEPVSADALVQALWGDDAASNANALQAHVSRVRRDLGPVAERLQTQAGGYRLEVQGGELDADRFQRALAQAHQAEPAVAKATLEEALALWRGPVLAELGLEAFALNEARRLQELRLTAIEERIAAELELGTPGIAELEALVAEHPLRERLRGQLMLALAHAGRHADALATYRAGRVALDELGMQPGRELRELEQAILTQERPASSLPALPTPTIGRRDDLERIGALLDAGTRLLTLTGPGGVGKTRLALEVARARGAGFVSLASVTAAMQIAPAIADALRITRVPGEDAADALARGLSGTVVLDNLEQVMGAGPVIARLLERADVVVLATSRQPLDVLAEQRYPVAPLAEDASVQLFEARAQARAVRLDDHEAVAAICRRLGGLPLAIELAAGRLGLLDAHGLADRLDDALALLGSGAGDLPVRQRTLRATLDWSYELLTVPEQEAFDALGAAAGGCDLEAALAITAADVGVLEALVDKSLVIAVSGRLYLLEPVHQYAAERLTDAACERHHAHYLALAERTRHELWAKGEGSEAYTLTRPERDNFRAALKWAIDGRRGDAALSLAGALDEYWNVTHAAEEGSGWCEGALAIAEDPQPRSLAIARVCLANLSRKGPLSVGLGHATAALELYRELGDDAGCAHALLRMTNLHFLDAEHERSRLSAQQALEYARAADDPALVGFALGRLALGTEDLATALALLDEGVATMRAAGAPVRAAICLAGVAFEALNREAYDEGAALMRAALPDALASQNRYVALMIEGNTGLLALFTGDVAEARARFAAELQAGREEALTVFVFEGLFGFGALAAQDGRDELAAMLHAAGHAHNETPIRAVERTVYDRIEARFYDPVRERLGTEQWERAAAKGRALTADRAIELAVSAL